ncbi:MAG: family 1 glycosylhydrolase [Chthoniobacterales bacterium]
MNGDFLWGVSTSGYQSEGGYNGEGQPQNNWSRAERSGRVETTGRAAEFWERADEDFARAQDMGLNAFRLGLEWPRIQPSTSLERLDEVPPFDFDAIDGYADRIAMARKRGLEPVVTFQHFTHPAWLGMDAWLEDRSVGLFGEYVATALERITTRLIEVHSTDPLRWLITLNEPNILIQNTYLAPHFPGDASGLKVGVRAMNRMLAAHVRAYNVIRDLYEERGWGEVMITTNTFCSDSYWSDQAILDLLSSREIKTPLNETFATNRKALQQAIREAKLPFHGGFFSALGRMLSWTIDRLAPKHFTEETFRFFLDELAASKRERVFDFIGLDYYDPFAAHVFRPPSFRDLEFKTKGVKSWLMDGMTSKWWDWRMLPEGLHFFCHYYTKFYDRPLLIAENGMAHRRKRDNAHSHERRDEMTRSEFLRRHLAEVSRLRKEGCPLVGYLHWSMTDNYEWGSYTPRFGLFSIDYEAGAVREEIDHLGDCPSETYAKLVAAARKKND